MVSVFGVEAGGGGDGAQSPSAAALVRGIGRAAVLGAGNVQGAVVGREFVGHGEFVLALGRDDLGIEHAGVDIHTFVVA